MTQVDR